MKILVCGGRTEDPAAVCAWLSLHAETATGAPVTCVVHGAARGADTGAGWYATQNRIKERCYPAAWKTYGNRAGVIRNAEMLKERPDIVIAFPGGTGTAGMMRLARQAGVRVVEVRRE